MNLVDQLVQQGILHSDNLIAAFRAAPRERFLPANYRENAEDNVPLPIGFGQTNSQPLTVAIMLELLAPQPGDDVLDIGSGSGWTAALLAHIVGEKGSVTAIEIVPELVEQGRRNLEVAGFAERVECRLGNSEEQLKDDESYHAILVSAAARAVPARLRLALAEGRRLVIPVEEGTTGDHVLVKLTRQGNDFIREEHRGFQFVPLV